jgi:hypothetical protein
LPMVPAPTMPIVSIMGITPLLNACLHRYQSAAAAGSPERIADK